MAHVPELDEELYSFEWLDPGIRWWKSVSTLRTVFRFRREGIKVRKLKKLPPSILDPRY